LLQPVASQVCLLQPRQRGQHFDAARSRCQQRSCQYTENTAEPSFFAGEYLPVHHVRKSYLKQCVVLIARRNPTGPTCSVRPPATLGPVHISNNIEATGNIVETTFDFVATKGNNVERFYCKISSFRQCQMLLRHCCRFWQKCCRFRQ